MRWSFFEDSKFKVLIAVIAFLAIATAEKSASIAQVSKFKSVDDLSYNHRLSVNGAVKRTHVESAKLMGRNDLSKGNRAPKDLSHVVVFACKNKNLDALENTLLDVSNPHSKNYGRYLTHDEVAALTSNPTSFKEIKKYLTHQGITIKKVSRSKGFITAEAPISKWEEVFGTEFHEFRQSDVEEHIVRAEEYSLPDILLDHVDSVFNVVQFPARRSFKKLSKKKVTPGAHGKTTKDIDGFVRPSLLNSYYHIGNNTGYSMASQAVVEVQDSSYSASDLSAFQTAYGVPQYAVTTGESYDCDEYNCVYGNLDVQYLTAVAQNTPTTFLYWEGSDFWLDWIMSVEEMDDPPLVITIDHLEYEHTISKSSAEAFNTAAMKLSAAGVTLVVGSGDDGVSGPDARDDPLQCGYFPQFPATSPYVTAVGATMGPEQGFTEIACTTTKGSDITTGGGFSTLFAAPSFQAASFSSYCTRYCSPKPSIAPTMRPTVTVTGSPTEQPSMAPSKVPSIAPSAGPSEVPSIVPTDTPVASVSSAPTLAPTEAHTTEPSVAPSMAPSGAPNTVTPSGSPSEVPSQAPSEIPSDAPTLLPTILPTFFPTF